MLLRDWSWSQRLPASSRSVRRIEAAILDGSKPLFPPAAYEREYCFSKVLCAQVPLLLWKVPCSSAFGSTPTEPVSQSLVYFSLSTLFVMEKQLEVATYVLLIFSPCLFVHISVQIFFLKAPSLETRSLPELFFAARLVFLPLIFRCSRILFSSFFTESGMQSCPRVPAKTSDHLKSRKTCSANQLLFSNVCHFLCFHASFD